VSVSKVLESLESLAVEGMRSGSWGPPKWKNNIRAKYNLLHPRHAQKAL
jgi:hypothetical protein